jgi:hypothetical protein
LNLTGQSIHVKGQKPNKSARKGLPNKSKKRAKQHKSQQGRDDLAHMGAVKQLPCVVCQSPAPNDAHHCKDKPDFADRHLYDQLPIGCKSAPTDTIPLCKKCHQDGSHAYHRDRDGWVKRNGPDYLYIADTRVAVGDII